MVQAGVGGHNLDPVNSGLAKGMGHIDTAFRTAAFEVPLVGDIWPSLSAEAEASQVTSSPTAGMAGVKVKETRGGWLDGPPSGFSLTR